MEDLELVDVSKKESRPKGGIDFRRLKNRPVPLIVLRVETVICYYLGGAFWFYELNGICKIFCNLQIMCNDSCINSDDSSFKKNVRM